MTSMRVALKHQRRKTQRFATVPEREQPELELLSQALSREGFGKHYHQSETKHASSHTPSWLSGAQHAIRTTGAGDQRDQLAVTGACGERMTPQLYGPLDDAASTSKRVDNQAACGSLTAEAPCERGVKAIPAAPSLVTPHSPMSLAAP